MPNRDYEDSPYNRNEGRFEGRGEWRDQSNASSREWDRQGDDFRQQEQLGRGASQQRGYQPGSFEERREQRMAQQDFGRGGYNQGQDYRSQQSYGPDYGRQQGSGQDYYRQGGGGQDYRSSQDWGHARGYGSSGQDFRSQDWSHRVNPNQEWGRSESSFGPGRGQDIYRSQSTGYGQGAGQDFERGPSRQDFSREQSNYGARDYGQRDLSRAQSDYGTGSSGQSYGGFRNDREDEGWGQQIRQAGQQAARSIKRVFRGPKGYRRSDERIREDVSDRLGMQDRLDPSEIEVAVTNGEVTLTGTVQSRAEKYAAEEIADEVSGVNEVNNQLRVRREGREESASTSRSTAAAGTASSQAGTASSQNESGAQNEGARPRNARA